MLAMMTMMMIMIKQKFRKEILVHVSNRKFVVAWSTYTTYIKYFLLFSRNLHGRFSFGTQLCFNGLLQEPITSAPVYWKSLNAITFVGGVGRGCCTAAENGHPP